MEVELVMTPPNDSLATNEEQTNDVSGANKETKKELKTKFYSFTSSRRIISIFQIVRLTTPPPPAFVIKLQFTSNQRRAHLYGRGKRGGGGWTVT